MFSGSSGVAGKNKHRGMGKSTIALGFGCNILYDGDEDGTYIGDGEMVQ